METFKRQTGEPNEVLTTRIIKDRAHGRCEFTWYEEHVQRRCTELHGERAQSFAGVVSLIPMPANGLLDTRVSSLKAYCQRHAYKLFDEMRNATGYDRKRAAKAPRNQVDMFGADKCTT